ncbi:glycine betaine ABC transporter substrate-binding protein [Streptomyces sp. NPDC057694]|uniref:glycine betaine ABC transporter substrate-binding protein n=1 Tax=Streptomyces sp. NPDC057694 TaxID=3346216 RepID=UPI0036876287
MPPAPPELRISVGNVASPPHRAIAAVTRRVLEAHGHRVTSIEAPAKQLFGLQVRGWLDILVSAWPTAPHASPSLRTQNSARVLSPHYHPRQVWAVPPYVPTSMVRTVADLARPAVVRHMSGIIAGVEADVGEYSAKVLAEFGLDVLGYSVVGISEAVLGRWVRQELMDRKWFVVQLLRPHRVGTAHGLRPLEEPEGMLGEAVAASSVISAEGLEHVHPDAVTCLENLYLGAEGIEEIDALVATRGFSPLQAADRYLSNRPGLLP